MKEIIFYVIAIFTSLSAIYVVSTRSLVRSVFFLFFTLFGVGMIYAFLGVDFIAVVQILLYVGGIAVLILFAVMLSKRPYKPEIFVSRGRTIGAALISGIIFIILLLTINVLPSNVYVPRSFPITKEIGGSLLTTYLLPFEVLSILLLCVLVGAAFMIRKEVKGD